jgi:protein tyrosine phosphatase (PTP) superfamily phosphohydrolase (DUF442 family)
MMNLIKVDGTPGVALWRGGRPESIDDVRSLTAKGIGRVVNLQSEWFEQPQWEEERGWCAGAGMPFFRKPMSWLTCPTPEQLDEAVVGLVADPDKGTFVHCHDGVDRTGAVVASYRVRYGGWSWGRAFGEMLELGFHYDRYLYWLPWLLPELQAAQVRVPGARP